MNDSHEGLIEAIQNGDELQWLADHDSALERRVTHAIAEKIAVAIEAETETDPNPETSNEPLNSVWNAAMRVTATIARQSGRS